MTNTTYNGWTNYATWRIALEWFDNYNPFEDEKDPYELSKMLQEYLEDNLMLDINMDLDINRSMCMDYAMAFISDVNWYEIAEHLIKEEVGNE